MTAGGRRAMLRNRVFFASLIDLVGISERELARRAGLSHSTVNHLVTGRRTSCSAATATSIAAALGIPPRVLFSF